MVNLSEQLIEENPIIRAARASSSAVASEPSVPVTQPGVASSKSSSTSTTVRSKETAENIEGVTMDSTLEAITKGVEERTILTVQRNNQLKAAGDKNIGAGDIAVSNAINTQIIAKQATVATLEADINKNEIFNARGGVDEMVKLAGAKKTAADRVVDTQAAVEELVNDDTVTGFFKKLFFKGDLVEEANVAQATFNKLDNIQDNFTQFASATDQALNDMKVTQTWATLKAEQDSIANVAQVKQLAFGIEADKLNAEATQEAINMSKDQAASKITMWQIAQQEKTFKATQKDREAIRARAEKDEGVKNVVIDGILKGKASSGISIYEGDDPVLIKKQRDEEWAKFSIIGGDAKEEQEAMFELGIGVVKPTPFQTLNAVALSDETRLLEGKEPMLNVLRAAAQEVFVDSQGVPGDATKQGFKLTPEILEGKVNEKFEAKMKGFEEEIKEGDTTNPNLAPPMSALIEMPGVKDEPLVTEILSPLFDNPDTKDYTPTQIIDIAFSSVRTKDNPEGKITFEQAISGISAIYTKAAVVNTSKQDRINKGWAVQDTYNVELKNLEFFSFKPVTEGAFTGTGRVVDIMDESALRVLGVKALSGAGSPTHLERVGLPASAGGTGATGNDGIIDFLRSNR